MSEAIGIRSQLHQQGKKEELACNELIGEKTYVPKQKIYQVYNCINMIIQPPYVLLMSPYVLLMFIA